MLTFSIPSISPVVHFGGSFFSETDSGRGDDGAGRWIGSLFCWMLSWPCDPGRGFSVSFPPNIYLRPAAV
jgi:hypothetical protein